jgi:hypothetical protein
MGSPPDIFLGSFGRKAIFLPVRASRKKQAAGGRRRRDLVMGEPVGQDLGEEESGQIATLRYNLRSMPRKVGDRPRHTRYRSGVLISGSIS